MSTHWLTKDGAKTLCGLRMDVERYARLWTTEKPDRLSCIRCERALAKARGEQP